MNTAKKIYVPKHLKPWSMPSNYFGATHEGSYVFLGQHRDSDVLTRSNFEVALERLGGESDTVEVIREGHWAVGWVEWIKICASDENALKLADEMCADLDDYPVLDEQAFSDKEYQENSDYLQSEMKYFLKELCEELELDQDKLSKREEKTLKQFIEAAYFEEFHYSGEAYFDVKTLKKRGLPDSGTDYYRTMKGASKKMIKLIDQKFGA